MIAFRSVVDLISPRDAGVLEFGWTSLSSLFLIFRGLGDRRDDAGSIFVILAVESKGTGVGELDQLFDLLWT